MDFGQRGPSTAGAARVLENALQEGGFRDLDRSLSSLRGIAQMLESLGLVPLMSILAKAAAKSADPDLAILQFQGLLERSPSAGDLGQRLVKDEQLFSLVRLLGAAPAIGAWLSHRSEAITEILPRPHEAVLEAERMTSLQGEIPDHKDARQALLLLQEFRRREGYRIAAFDLLTPTPLPAILEAVSHLADFVTVTVLRLTQQKLGMSAEGFAVVALGKLGGSELNFSSDIDLIYVCSDAADLRQMTRLARQFTRRLGEASPEGRLYRVDLRLRPMGRMGEVVYPLAAYRQYFETNADTFDRLAMLKSRFIAGDARLGTQFERMVSSFVFRKYLDPAAIDEVRWLKRRSDARLSELEKQENIKLGTGGIREVEFFAQTLQLLYGGRDLELRSRTTLQTLETLQGRGYISGSDYQKLTRGYTFLRRTENLLQLDSDLQVQSIPQQQRSRLRLARLLDFPDYESFKMELAKVSREIHSVFHTLFTSRQQGELRDLVLNPGLQRKEAIEILQGAGIQDDGGVFSSLKSLAEASAYPVSASHMRTLLARVLPNLLQHAARSGDPQGFVTRFDRLCDRLGSRAHLYQSLIETSDFAHRLYQILLLGEPLSQRLIRYPEVVDLLSKPPLDSYLPRPLPALDLELSPTKFAVQIRDYKEREELKLSLHSVRKPSEPELRAKLTQMAERILARTLDYLLGQRPQLAGSDITLFGLGKLGGSELTFHSDLDLVMVYRAESPEMAPLFDDLVRDLKRLLEGQFSGPSTYRLDFRLRPEGRKSSPATPLESFQTYCHRRIQLWERLAYTKARPIYSHGRNIRFREILGPPLRQEIEAGEIEQVLHLRERKQNEHPGNGLFRVKLDPGGLFDLQLAVELILLREGLEEPHTASALTLLRKKGFLTPSQHSILSEALEMYQALETALRLTTGTSTNLLAGDLRRIDQIAGLCGVHGSQELSRRCNWLSRGVTTWFRDVFGRYPVPDDAKL